MENFGVSRELLDKLAAAKQVVAKIEQEINQTALRNLGIKPGEIFCHTETGLHYKIEGFHAWADLNTVRISVDAYRYYQSGRRAGRTARSRSHLSFSSLERVK